MATEDSPGQPVETTAMVPESLREIEPVDNAEPVAPRGVTDEEARELRTRASSLVQELEEATGARELELVDNVTNVGLQSQRNAGRELDLLRGRVGDMITNEGPGAEIAGDLIELRMALNQINPHELSKRGFIGQLFSFVPFAGKLAPIIKALERIAIRYEAVSRQVSAIETKLREGRMMLTRDNVELRQLYEQVEAQQLPVQKNAYLGELVIQELTQAMERTREPLKADRLRNALHDVSMRVQDLRTMEAVYTQFFVSIEITRQNNTRLGQSVERTLALATNVVTVGLAIQTALSRQKKVLEATQRTREFLGAIVAANAGAIREHTATIGDVYNNPVIAMDKIEQAHNELMEAMDLADRLKEEGIDAARVNIARLGQLSSELQQRTGALLRQRDAEVESVEA